MQYIGDEANKIIREIAYQLANGKIKVKNKNPNYAIFISISIKEGKLTLINYTE